MTGRDLSALRCLIKALLKSERDLLTSLSSCFANMVICFITNLGASSDSLTMNEETDFGPLVSFVLNSLLLSSRKLSSASWG
jgi:hypothetical protein